MNRLPAAVLTSLAMVAALFAAVWGIVDWLDIAPDETTRWRDDAFYEFSWAANVAAGRGADHLHCQQGG